VQLGEYSKAGGPCVLLCLAWIGTWLRHPQALWSLNSRLAGAGEVVERPAEGWASRRA
jgi:hypothetical protein